MRAWSAPQALHETADAVAAAADELAVLGDNAGEAKAHAVQAQALAGLGRVGACEAALDRALAAARKAGDRAPPFQPVTRLETPNALVNRYRTRDGRWILLAMVQEAKDWPRLPVALLRTNLLGDLRFDTVAARRELTLANGEQPQTVDSPLSIAGVDKVAPSHAPTPGQHSDEVLRELGYLEEEISRLRQCGAVG